MAFFDNLIENLPEVSGPTQKRLPFKDKLKWTLIVLMIFFVLGMIPLFGLGENALQQFEFLSIILGASFGSIISLGIGPIVTASIVLQLLNGSGIWKFDLTSHEGKKRFQGTQKLFSIFFIILEGAIYVLMGGLSPSPIGTQFSSGLVMTQAMFFQFQMILILQLFIGGVLIMFMDEIVSKWGFGSGISLFIAAGVAQQVFIGAFSFIPDPQNPDALTGAVPVLFQSLASGDPTTAFLKLAAIIATIAVFFMAVYVQAMKVEIPLSFGRIRGHGIRWPLNFLYTSNIPVILVAALLANVQLFGTLLQNWGHPLLGTFSQGQAVSGFALWVQGAPIIDNIVTGTFTWALLGQSLIYMLFMIVGSVIFSIFWVQSAGMDARSQAKQMMASGLQIPGFRKDERVLERILNRYIWPLTIMGAIAVGFLASFADLLGALSRGTGILLTVMIIYQLYEHIAREHMMDMNPMMRKFMGGG
ncbi:TPA: preprotein translocase subunit SecY [Candidatus Woesearchaeota archaeon]|nr:preprotein translocase subunit SecY [Candidatus Woesearchaeota archaeon]HIH32050.1 preprotein translocase subunit SecY [Candidatus Woesearchaeota archaeon]HIH54994.1 preprotein translocase subunit SecY [Candidatus Woesearchaeota archaeon]HIJ01651.1 preprotein translocase subunit SecY [Candidatus Woesearchaeota archaeon]HIJ13355.1 preprotein translocase subunit SecY [Candidatus Woesearchaeota archaeon]